MHHMPCLIQSVQLVSAYVISILYTQNSVSLSFQKCNSKKCILSSVSFIWTILIYYWITKLQAKCALTVWSSSNFNTVQAWVQPKISSWMMKIRSSWQTLQPLLCVRTTCNQKLPTEWLRITGYMWRVHGFAVKRQEL